MAGPPAPYSGGVGERGNGNVGNSWHGLVREDFAAEGDRDAAFQPAGAGSEIMKFYKAQARKARIEIIPMIDTIFFLLVYFMFQTLVMVKMEAMEVSIPKPSPPSNAAPPPRCVVKVDAAGNYTVNGALVDPSEITDDVDQAVAKNPNTLVIIAVDPTQKVQPLITCMDAVNSASKPDGTPVNTIINGQGGVSLPV